MSLELQSKRIVLTGVTGFLGSSLAARFLAEGAQVTALSRADVDGSRTLQAIETAICGFGLAMPDGWKGRLSVRELQISVEELRDAGEIWHCGAEMNYGFKCLPDSFSFNTGYSSWLFKQFESAHRDRSGRVVPRFNYVSTAFVAPRAWTEKEGSIPEILHEDCDAQNAYQLSKWATEQVLWQMARVAKVGLTIFRPSIIVGHSVTGWGGGKPNGFYQFADAFRLARQMGKPSLQFEILPTGIPDLVAVDSVTNACLALSCASDLEYKAGKPAIVHCSGGSQATSLELLEVIAGLTCVKYQGGPPRDAFEAKIAQVLDNNRVFAEQRWRFSTERLDALIGRDTWWKPLGRHEVHRATQVYLLMDQPERVGSIGRAVSEPAIPLNREARSLVAHS